MPALSWQQLPGGSRLHSHAREVVPECSGHLKEGLPGKQKELRPEA